MPSIPIPMPNGLIAARDTTVIIPEQYSAQDSSPSPGIVVGITLGSVGGFLFLLALIYSALGWVPFGLWSWGTSSVTDASSEATSSRFSRSVLSFRSRSKYSKAPRRAHRRRDDDEDTEMYEVRRTRQTRTTTAAGSGRPPVVVVPGPSSSRTAPRVVEEESESEDDEIVVEEEHEPRRDSRRHSGSRRSDDRRYRDSDRGSRRDSRRYSRD